MGVIHGILGVMLPWRDGLFLSSLQCVSSFYISFLEIGCKWTEPFLIIIHGRPCSHSLHPIWSVLLRNTQQDQAFRKLNAFLLDSSCKASLASLRFLSKV